MNAILALQIIEAALKLAPELVAEFKVLFASGEPTQADWEALRARVNKSYDDWMADNFPSAFGGPPPPATGG